MISGLLLAAGESTRMGTLKALLEWEGTTLIEYQVAQLRAARLGEVVVVLGHEAERLWTAVSGFRGSGLSGLGTGDGPNPLSPFPSGKGDDDSLPLGEGETSSPPLPLGEGETSSPSLPLGEGETSSPSLPLGEGWGEGSDPIAPTCSIVPGSQSAEPVAESVDSSALTLTLSQRERGQDAGPHPNPLPEGEGTAGSPLPFRGGGQGVRFVLNPDYRGGKTSSIRAGVAALSADATGVLILGVDQPRPSDLLDYLIERHGDSLLSVPVQAGRRGHPPIFARALFPELLALSEEREGLREVLRAHAAEINAIPVDSPIVHLNLNRPEDYAAARR